jgi:hypothetical protein
MSLQVEGMFPLTLWIPETCEPLVTMPSFVSLAVMDVKDVLEHLARRLDGTASR